MEKKGCILKTQNINILCSRIMDNSCKSGPPKNQTKPKDQKTPSKCYVPFFSCGNFRKSASHLRKCSGKRLGGTTVDAHDSHSLYWLPKNFGYLYYFPQSSFQEWKVAAWMCNKVSDRRALLRWPTGRKRKDV